MCPQSLEGSGIRTVGADRVVSEPQLFGACISRARGYPSLPRRALPFLRLATPRATSPVTFHVSVATPVAAAGNTIRLVTVAVVVVVVVAEWFREPAGIIYAFVQPECVSRGTGTTEWKCDAKRSLVGGRRNFIELFGKLFDSSVQ